MVSSNGGGRRRGRPKTLSPEQKLERERQRWRNKKARKRKAEADAKWQRGTNCGYFARLWVPHYNRLTETLVAADYLHKGDVNIAPRVDEAADELFEAITNNDWHWGNRSSFWGQSRRLAPGQPGTVRIRMTSDLVDRIVDSACEDEFKKLHRPPTSRLDEEVARAHAYLKECEDFHDRLLPGPERLKASKEAARAREAYLDLCSSVEPPVDQDELAKFADDLRHNRRFLQKAAENLLFRWYAGYVFDPTPTPCNCKLALPACDCISRFKPDPRPGILQGPPKSKGPKAGKVLAKRSLYSGPVPRWWRTEKHHYENDPIIRSHARLIEEPPMGRDDEQD